MNREILFRGKLLDSNDWVHYWEFYKYGVNKNGEVCSFDFNHTGMTKKIKQYTDRDGYKYVFLNIEGKRYKRQVHRMVLSTFIDNELNKPQINHINGKRNDNRLENLEWATARENVIHSYKINGRKPTQKQIESGRKHFKGINNPKHKITKEIAEQIRIDRGDGLLLRELSSKYNLSTAQCSAICSSKVWN